MDRETSVIGLTMLISPLLNAIGAGHLFVSIFNAL